MLLFNETVLKTRRSLSAKNRGEVFLVNRFFIFCFIFCFYITFFSCCLIFFLYLDKMMVSSKSRPTNCVVRIPLDFFSAALYYFHHNNNFDKSKFLVSENFFSIFIFLLNLRNLTFLYFEVLSCFPVPLPPLFCEQC